MTPIIPETLTGQSFSQTKSGYAPSEVDDYISRLTESITLLHRENAALRNQLRTIEDAQSEAERILKNAEVQKDQIIEDAYLKADRILADVQTNCNSVLRGFKEKAEAQAKALADMKQSILKFKYDLFEQYRMHIEMIERCFPSDESDRDWTPDAYSQHILEELKRKFSEQYEIFPETQMEFSFWSECKTQSETEKQKKAQSAEHASPRKKLVKKTPAVADLIAEHENSLSKCAIAPASARQFMLDFDHPSEKGVVIEKQN
ncbi:MAG: DivIVA domain-containing protein [Clostridia bacterium]|nr:DivIVA domain-containing protein [Clostridia bacterium]